MDYEKILESLKICSEVGTSCEGCSGRGERHSIANLTKAAAIAIETLLHALDMAKRERDVVTKRMIELEQETVTNRNGLNEPLTLDELRKMDNHPVWIEDVGEYKWHGSGWAIVDREHCLVRKASNGNPAFFERYGKGWVAYRFGPLRPDGHCEHGESEEKDG